MLYFHSVTLDKEKCKGCTNCIKNCPTEAIRVRNGKAKIIKERCIDCGECIRICPYHAKLAVTDGFSQLENYRYNIAMPAPSFYGQFRHVGDRNKILTAFTLVGFDDVFEVAIGAQYATEETKYLLNTEKLQKPVISSACPVALRLIRERFPGLLGNIIKVLSPMEIAAYLARRAAKEKTGLSDEEIGVFFITPCPAKVTSIKSPLTLEESYVSGAISVSEAYLKILPYIKGIDQPKEFPLANLRGLAWGRSGGECEGTEVLKYIAVDGIKNVINILEELEDEKIDDIDFIELSACPGGCVGGSLNVTNSFVSSTRIKNISDEGKNNTLSFECSHEELWRKKQILPSPVAPLDSNLAKAMEKMELMENIYANLPKLDCGSCGAPSCRALAEDVVRGFRDENDCIVKMRERIKELGLEAKLYANKSENSERP